MRVWLHRTRGPLRAQLGKPLAVIQSLSNLYSKDYDQLQCRHSSGTCIHVGWTAWKSLSEAKIPKKGDTSPILIERVVGGPCTLWVRLLMHDEDEWDSLDLWVGRYMCKVTASRWNWTAWWFLVVTDIILLAQYWQLGWLGRRGGELFPAICTLATAAHVNVSEP